MISGAARYCRDKGVDPIGLGITASSENDPETRMMTKLTYSFTFPESFDAELQAGILENTANCYVYKHILTPPTVVIQ